MTNYYKYVLQLLIIALAAFGAHYLLSSSFGLSQEWSKTEYTLSGMYFFGFAASLVVTIFLFFVNYSMPKNLGLVFLVVMTLKLVASYIYIQKGLNQFENKFLELNFLVVFFLFLFHDVYIAFRMLNQEEKSN